MYPGSVNCTLTNYLYFSCVFRSYVSPRLFPFSRLVALILSFRAQLYHIKVVKWHLVAVSTEDVHEAVLVHISGVSITSSGTASNHTEFGLCHWVVSSRHGEALSSLSAFAHLLVVGVEGVIGILNDERLLHRDRGG